VSSLPSDVPDWIHGGPEGARTLLALALAERYAELLRAGFARCETEGERQRAAMLAAAMTVLRED
jgi:hypothetical protein